MDSQLVPLGFMCMQRCIDAGFVLKAINVKEILNNERAKERTATFGSIARSWAGSIYSSTSTS